MNNGVKYSKMKLGRGKKEKTKAEGCKVKTTDECGKQQKQIQPRRKKTCIRLTWMSQDSAV